MDEFERAGDDEFVYRRIHQNYIDARLAIPVQPAAFRPTEHDTTGLSVFRGCFVAPADTLADVDADKVQRYCVARLAVRALRELGLSVVPEPTKQGPRGHAVIPELSRPAYLADKGRWKQVLVQLATLASADIVYQPSA